MTKSPPLMIYVPSKEALKLIIEHEIKVHGPQCSLRHLDTSRLRDMSELFDGSSFQGDISTWDTSEVRDMTGMFKNSAFNGDISQWNTSNLQWMGGMFAKSQFNGDISNWNTANVVKMNHVFMSSLFNGDISKWNTSKVTTMASMFQESLFQGDISNWDVSNVKDMSQMFEESRFLGDISKWRITKDCDTHFAFNHYHPSVPGMMCLLNDELAPGSIPEHLQAIVAMVQSLNVPIYEGAHLLMAHVQRMQQSVVIPEIFRDFTA